MTLDQLGKAEEYLSAFTNRNENKYSKAMFLEMQKLKCTESTEWLVYINICALTFLVLYVNRLMYICAINFILGS